MLNGNFFSALLLTCIASYVTCINETTLHPRNLETEAELLQKSEPTTASEWWEFEGDEDEEDLPGRRQAKSNDPSSGLGSDTSTKILKDWGPVDYRVSYIEDLLQKNIGAAFFDGRIDNYSRFVILEKQSTIFVVGNDVTLLKLDIPSFFLLDTYTLPPPTKAIPACHDPWTCHQAKEISLLAVMPNEQMIWFCYAHYYHYRNRPPQHAESGCMVPQLGNLAQPIVQWDNRHFSYLDPTHPAGVLNAADGFTYISAFAPNYVRIFRTHMPDWNGHVNWTGALVTDRSRNFIAEPASVLLSFETENEIYFVLREQSSQNPTNFDGPTHQSSRAQIYDGNQPDVARLVRICKGDRGGLPHVSEQTFGTFAKADLSCQAADQEGGHFAYTLISAAYWDNTTQRLYVVFRSVKWAPVGSALCVYTRKNIEAAFNGPVMKIIQSGQGRWSSAVPNAFINICERFNSKNLSAEELTLGRRISLTFPNRYNPIKPHFEKAVISQTGKIWEHIQAYDLPQFPPYYTVDDSGRTTIVWLGTTTSLTRLAIYEPATKVALATGMKSTVCKLNEIHTGPLFRILSQKQTFEYSSVVNLPADRPKRGNNMNLHYNRPHFRTDGRALHAMQNEEIRQIQISQPHIYILTNHQLLWLPLTVCSIYKSYDDCIQSKDPHCGWSWPEGRCASGQEGGRGVNTNWFNTFSPSVDRRRSENPQCPPDNHSLNIHQKAWSEWYDCPWLSHSDMPNPSSFDSFPADQIVPQSYGICRCRVCLSQSDCSLGSQEVINCTLHEKNWLPWTVWSRCDLTTRVQTRQRLCPSRAICVGSSKEQRLCPSSTLWSQRFDPLSFKARSNDQIPLPHVTPVVMQESFSLTQLILVATCCVLVGSLVTAVLFFTFWRSCHRGLRAPRHKYPHHCRCSQTEFYTEGGRHDPSPKGASHMEINWVVTKGNKSEWSHKLCDPETIWNKDANGSDRYQIPPNLERLRSRGFHSEPVNTQYDSCLSQLISATPLPSPVSVVSSPSTASTVLKEKVAFFPPETEEEHPDIGLSSVEKETAVTPPNWTATKPRKPTPPRITIEPKISSLHPPQRTESSKTESDGSSKATLTPGQKTVFHSLWECTPEPSRITRAQTEPQAYTYR